MDEVVTGVFHWSAIHPNTGGRAHSYALEQARTVLDPMVSDEALELLRDRPPERIVLTNRHHWRQADRLVAEFGVPVLCPESGLREFEGDERQVEPYRYDEEIAPGVIAREVGAICSDDAALEIRVGPGLLAFADGLMRPSGELRFVSDSLLGDDPETVKRGLTASLARLGRLDFDGLLFAHGDPLASGGADALRAFVESRGERPSADTPLRYN